MTRRQRVAAALVLIAPAFAGCGPSPTARLPEGSGDGRRRDAGRVEVANRVSYVLEDGEESHRRFPDTFEIPPAEMRRNLKEGQIVKLMFTISAGEFTQTERMWVIVKKRDRDHYLGVLDNDPQCTGEMRSGLAVRFEPRHVIRIYGDRAP